LQLKLTALAAEFRPNFRHFLGVARDLFGGRDILSRFLFDTGPEYLSVGIWWLTLWRGALAMRRLAQLSQLGP
jgi:hypothetical protein